MVERYSCVSSAQIVGCKLTANRKFINNVNHNNNLETGDTHIQPGNQKSICGGVNIEEIKKKKKKNSFCICNDNGEDITNTAFIWRIFFIKTAS